MTSPDGRVVKVREQFTRSGSLFSLTVCENGINLATILLSYQQLSVLAKHFFCVLINKPLELIK